MAALSVINRNSFELDIGYFDLREPFSSKVRGERLLDWKDVC